MIKKNNNNMEIRLHKNKIDKTLYTINKKKRLIMNFISI